MAKIPRYARPPKLRGTVEVILPPSIFTGYMEEATVGTVLFRGLMPCPGIVQGLTLSIGYMSGKKASVQIEKKGETNERSVQVDIRKGNTYYSEPLEVETGDRVIVTLKDVEIIERAGSTVQQQKILKDVWYGIAFRPNPADNMIKRVRATESDAEHKKRVMKAIAEHAESPRRRTFPTRG